MCQQLQQSRGILTDHISGHYKALEWSEQEQKYVDNPDLGILVVVVVRVD